MMMPSLLLAQSYAKKTLITLGDKKISAQEFMNTYEKNNVKTDVLDKKNIDEYQWEICNSLSHNYSKRSND
jgi:hypothetical protein